MHPFLTIIAPDDGYLKDIEMTGNSSWSFHRSGLQELDQ